jgi:ADP-ribosyl-[dinitrogen reductase] hydrolase
VLPQTTSFKEAILKAVNLGDDADTTAGCGGVAGAFYEAAIPRTWLSSWFMLTHPASR